MPTSDKTSGNSIPKVAVIIPCYNHGKYVEECIKSVVEQDYPQKAIFISDEGSTDDSWDNILGLMEDKKTTKDGVVIAPVKGTTVVASKNPNPNGPSGARNRLIKMAWESSDFFSMLDADDYYLPSKITKGVNIMMEQPDVISLVYSDAIIYHENTGISIREYREPYSRYRLEQECIVSNTPLISKTAFAKVGLYNETMRTAEDWHLWLRITADDVAIHIPEALHVYRVTGKNASNTVHKAIWEENWRKIQQLVMELKR
jgi:glycosyltransferase involved in cell wall biosynthesis